MKIKHHFLSLFYLLLILSCNNNIRNYTSVTENEVMASISRNPMDSTQLDFILRNNSNKEIIIPTEIGTKGNKISFLLPNGDFSKFQGSEGSWGMAHILKPMEEYRYDFPSYEKFMLVIPTIEKDQPGWFTLIWHIDLPAIKESVSIKVYYDYDKIINELKKN